MTRRDWLELYRPDRPDPDVPDADALQQALKSDSSLLARHEAIRKADERIGAALLSVGPSPDFQARLLGRLQTEAEGERKRVRDRRRFVMGIGLAAAAVVAAFLLTPTATIDLHWNSVAPAAIEWALAEPTLQNEQVKPPADWPRALSNAQIVATGTAELDIFPARIMAYRINIRGRHALVLAAPRAWLADDFAFGTIYTESSRGPRGMSAKAFGAGDWAFIVVFEAPVDIDPIEERLPIT